MDMFKEFDMNNWDRDNLNFLLNANQETLEDWHHYASPDDYAYALELLQQARTELAMKELAIIDDEAVEDLAAATTVLAKFRL
jgi:hypothetical protein